MPVPDPEREPEHVPEHVPMQIPKHALRLTPKSGTYTDADTDTHTLTRPPGKMEMIQ